MVSEDVTVPFQSDECIMFGRALEGCYVTEYKGVLYWVVSADYHKSRVQRQDRITFRLAPHYFASNPAPV